MRLNSLDVDVRFGASYVAAHWLFVGFLCGSVVCADDWPMRGKTIFRESWVEQDIGPHLWNTEYGGPVDKDRVMPESRKWQIKWKHGGFRQSMCDPVAANGLVWIGTADPIGDSDRDCSVLACFDANTGELLYQHISEKLGNSGQDWPGTGNTSSPFILGHRLWFCTNRLEVICLNIQPLIERTGQPVVEWTVDIKTRFNVIPTDVHLGNRASRCSIVGVDGRIFINTTNSFQFQRDPHVVPEAPSLVCLNQDNGVTIWTDNSPGGKIARNQHCNPVIIRDGDRNLIAIGQGDGFVRAFECATGKMAWQFDLNASRHLEDSADTNTHTRLLTESPTFDGKRLFFSIGENREARLMPGRIYCIAPFGGSHGSDGNLSGDIAAPNSESRLIWDYGITPKNDGVKATSNFMPVSIAGLCVTNEFVFTADVEGIVRCFNKKTGRTHWQHDMQSAVIGTPLVVGDTLYVADEDGDVEVLSATATYDYITNMNHDSAIESSPIYANDTLFIVTRKQVFAIGK